MEGNYGAASRFAQKQIGGLFTDRETEIPVDLATVIAVPKDNNRIGYILTNTGTTNITIRTAPPVVSGVGILLLGNGATWRMNYRDDLDGVGLPFYAISDLAGGSLYLYELVQAFAESEAVEQ